MNTKKQSPEEIKDEIEVFEILGIKLHNVLKLSTKDWNEKVSPILREFLAWHKSFMDKKQLTREDNSMQ